MEASHEKDFFINADKKVKVNEKTIILLVNICMTIKEIERNKKNIIGGENDYLSRFFFLSTLLSLKIKYFFFHVRKYLI